MYVVISGRETLVGWAETYSLAQYEADWAEAWEQQVPWCVLPATDALAKVLGRSDVEWLTVLRDDDVVDLCEYKLYDSDEPQFEVDDLE